MAARCGLLTAAPTAQAAARAMLPALVLPTPKNVEPADDEEPEARKGEGEVGEPVRPTVVMAISPPVELKFDMPRPVPVQDNLSAQAVAIEAAASQPTVFRIMGPLAAEVDEWQARIHGANGSGAFSQLKSMPAAVAAGTLLSPPHLPHHLPPLV